MMEHSVDQRSAEWIEMRLGKVTASRVADLMARTKTGWGASRANYAAELIAERLTGQPGDRFVTAAMQHGIDTEADARAAYEQRELCCVREVGFVDHPRIEQAGCSPDGLVGDDGLFEAKCPNTATHLDTLQSKAIPGKYVKQMLWQMACTGRKWCDFASYDPRLPDSMKLIVIRLHRDDDLIAEIEAEVAQFLAEIDERVAALQAEYEPQKEAA